MSNVAAIPQSRAVALPTRLKYPLQAADHFGVDAAQWKALVEVAFPLATSPESVMMVLAYCKARNLDPLKKTVHIVPVYSKAAGGMIDTVWPGIAELRTTAFRTKLYAGRDETEFGPDVTQNLGGVEVTFPEWARITVYRLVDGEPRKFVGPKVYWLETYATAGRNSVAPNDIWKKRGRGQIDKCAEGAALRAAFPEELGGEITAEEMQGQIIDGGAISQPATPRPTRDQYASVTEAEVVEEPEDGFDADLFIDQVAKQLHAARTFDELNKVMRQNADEIKERLTEDQRGVLRGAVSVAKAALMAAFAEPGTGMEDIHDAALHFRKRIADAATVDELNSIGADLDFIPAADYDDKLEPMMASRRKELGK